MPDDERERTADIKANGQRKPIMLRPAGSWSTGATGPRLGRLPGSSRGLSGSTARASRTTSSRWMSTGGTSAMAVAMVRPGTDEKGGRGN